MKASKVISERGKEVLECAKFTKYKELKSGKTYWRCTIRSCKTKVFTVGKNILFPKLIKI